MYDDQGNITRAGAEQVIKGGGSVSIKGKLYSSIDKLPDEASFAAGDPTSEAKAREKLQKQIADAQAQLTRLGPPGGVQEVSKAKTADKPADEGSDPNAGRRHHAGRS